MNEPLGVTDPVRVLFMAGMGRSGSTIVSRLLGQVPSVCSVGELCYVWDQGVLNDRTCGCGQTFHRCPFWQTVGRHAFGGWEHVDAEEAVRLRRGVERTRFVPALATGRSTPAFAERLDRYTRLMASVYAGIQAASGSDVVVDSSKYPASAYLARQVPAVDLRLLHLVRDSRGVAYSWAKLVNRPDRDGKPLARFSPTRSAVDWNLYNTFLEAMPRFGVKTLRVRYEDFVADPAGTLTGVLDFAGRGAVADLDFVLGHEVELRPTHNVAGNPMRFRSGRERLVRDDAWTRDMPVAQRRLVTALTSPGLLRYGYSLGGPQG